MIDIVAAMDDPQLFGPWFAGESWDGHRAILKAAFALPMTDSERAFFRSVAERDPPTSRARELWIVAGRRSGKDSIASLLVAHAAALFDPGAAVLRPGERALCLCLATDRDQAKIVLNYTRAYFGKIDLLEGLVTNSVADGFELENNIDVAVGTSNYRATRGRPILCAVLDECSFWPAEDSATPDTETYRAIVPGMATVPGAMLVGISTGYKKAGLLYQKYRNHYGRDGDVLVVKAPSLALNPTLDPAIVERALADDPEAARAEWLGEFRDDIAGFVTPEAIDALVIPGRYEIPPVSGTRYTAFVDPAGGSGGDSFALAIGHLEDETVVLDAVRETRPRFSPDSVIDDYSGLLKAYGVDKVTGDRWGGEFPRERFKAKGITYELADRPRSDLYRDTLPLLNSGRVELLDLTRLKAQFLGLERRTARGGRDSIDHQAGGHDDLCNVVAGVIIAAQKGSGYDSSLSWVDGPNTDEGDTEAGANAAWRQARLWNHLNFPR